MERSIKNNKQITDPKINGKQYRFLLHKLIHRELLFIKDKNGKRAWKKEWQNFLLCFNKRELHTLLDKNAPF